MCSHFSRIASQNQSLTTSHSYGSVWTAIEFLNLCLNPLIMFSFNFSFAWSAIFSSLNDNIVLKSEKCTLPCVLLVEQDKQVCFRNFRSIFAFRDMAAADWPRLKHLSRGRGWLVTFKSIQKTKLFLANPGPKYSSPSFVEVRNFCCQAPE